MNNFAVSLILFILMLYSLVVWTMMIAYYDMLLVLIEAERIVPRKVPIMRDKFDLMTFTQR